MHSYLRTFGPSLMSLTYFLPFVMGSFAQGLLTPPGAPAPTMKTLDQVEARIPLTTFPATINESGSYYLTRSVDTIPAPLPVVTINASDVTIDLNGYTLSTEIGTGTAPNQSAFYVATSTVANVTIRNGTIRGLWYSGLEAPLARGMILEDLQVIGTFNNGFTVGENARVTRCIVDGTSMNFMSIAGIVCGRNSIVRNCIATRCGGHGFFFGLGVAILESVASSNGGQGIHGDWQCTAYRCSAIGNDGAGIYITSLGRFTDCTALVNGGAGIVGGDLMTIAGCVAGNNDATGIYVDESSLITDCMSYVNMGHGFRSMANARIVNCVSWSNVDGFNGRNDSILSGCIAQKNSNKGFNFGMPSFDSASAFTDCAATDNSTGFDCGRYARMDRCTAFSNSVHGAELGANSSAARSVFSENGGNGLIGGAGNVINGCSAYGNTLNGFLLSNSCAISDCTATRNDDTGIQALISAVISRCSAYENGVTAVNPLANGIEVDNSCRVMDCVTVRNRGAGISCTSGGNHISGNLTRSNTGDGIHLANNGNLVTGNLAENNVGVEIDFAGFGKVAPRSLTPAGAGPHDNF